MKKKEFLEKLRLRLAILQEEEIKDIITEYEGFIAEKKKKGKSEVAAIKEFGDFDELVKEILSAYKIKNDNSKDMVSDFFDQMGRIFENIGQKLSSKDTGQIIHFVIEIVFLLLLILLFRWPIEIIFRLGRDVFMLLPAGLGGLLSGLWRFLLEVGYFVLAVIFFIKIFQERFLKSEGSSKKKVVDKKLGDKIGEEIQEVLEEVAEAIEEALPAKKTKPVKKVKGGEKATESFNIFLVIIKILAFFALLPTVFITFGLIIALGLGITLFVSGVFYWGILLTLLAMVGLSVAIAELLFRFIFSLKISGVRVFWHLIIGITLLGVGVSVATFEIVNTEYIDQVPSNFERLERTEIFNSADIRFIDSGQPITYVPTDEFGDEIRIVVGYFAEFSDPSIINNNGIIWFDLNHDNRIFFGSMHPLIFRSFMENLGNRRIYRYGDLQQITVRVYGSKENIRRIWDDRENHYRDEERESLLNELEQAREERENWEQKYWDLRERYGY